MSTIFAGDLSRHFRNDGSHAIVTQQERLRIGRALTLQLVLHERLVVPVEDFTALEALATFLGPEPLSRLLELGRIKIVRTIGSMCYIVNQAEGQLATYEGQENTVAAHAEMSLAVDRSLARLSLDQGTRTRLQRAIISATSELPTSEIVAGIRQKTFAQLRQSSIWKPEYEHPTKDVLRLPGPADMTATIYSPDEPPSRSPTTTLLALARGNFELELAQRFSADAMSTTTPIADGAALNLAATAQKLDGLDHLVTTVAVPDLTSLLDGDSKASDRFVDLVSGRPAAAFRTWFHGQEVVDPKEYLEGYLDLIHKAGPLDGLPQQVARFVVFKILGQITGVGVLTDIFDAFILNRMIDGRSPKFFVGDLRGFRGAVKLKT